MTSTSPLLFQRLHSMFSSSSSDHDEDHFRELCFSKVINAVEKQHCFDSISWSSIDGGSTAKDCISDVYVYITHDRTLLVNRAIEAELTGSEEQLHECLEELKQQDNYHLKLVVEHRKFLFN